MERSVDDAMRYAALVVGLTLVLLAALPILADASPRPPMHVWTESVDPPSPPKTRAQIASEAYSLQAEIAAAAGRKTSNASDGTGGIRTVITNSDTRGIFFDAKNGTCTSDSFTLTFEPPNGCDDDDSTTWISANSAYPHWFILNLSASLPVNGVMILWGNYPPTSFHVDCWVLGTFGLHFVPYGNFTSVVNDLNKNRTYRLDGNGCKTDRVRIYGMGTSATGTDFMGFFEPWPYRDYPYGVSVSDSAALGMGDWSSQFHKLTWVQTGSVDMFGRVSNNSDMSDASTWNALTSGTDEDSLNLVAGYFQYRAYLNTSTSSISAISVQYRGQSTGDPPSKTAAGEILHDSHYVHARFDLNQTSVIKMVASDRSLVFDGSFVGLADADGLLNITDFSEPTAPPIRLTITVRNSTFSNASHFFLIHSNGAIYRSASVDFYMDNATVQHFNSTWGRTIATSPVAAAPYVHDSDIFDYNRGNLSFGAIPTSNRFDRVHTIDFRPQGLTFNGVITDNPTEAKWNYMEGGFLQFVYGSDGQGIAVGPGYPVEYVNWSYNYASRSKHTVFGSYGTAFGHFADPTLRNGYYHTIYRNYINNSRYIAIQSSGNVSGLRVIGNYIQGTSPSFTEAIGIFEQDHDFLVQGNMIWNMNTTNNRGITITCFVFNVTVSQNIIFDVGVWHIRFECMGLKYRNATGVERSDYSWKGMNIAVVDNYLEGAHINGAIGIDSGYIRFFNNTVVDADKVFDISDGWGVSNVSYVWVDWTGGFPQIVPSMIAWDGSVGAATNRSDFWVRDLGAGRITVRDSGGPFVLTVRTSYPSYWGLLQTRCVRNPPEESSSPTDAEVFLWTGITCEPIRDMTSTNYSGDGTRWITAPNRWYNITRNVNFNTKAHVPLDVPPGDEAIITDLTTGARIPNEGGSVSWGLARGHSYSLEFQNPIEITIQTLVIPIFVIIFLLIVIVGLIAVAFEVGRRIQHE